MDFGGVLELGYKYFNPSESIPHVSGTMGTLLVLERNLLRFFPYCPRPWAQRVHLMISSEIGSFDAKIIEIC